MSLHGKSRPANTLLLHVCVPRERCDALFDAATEHLSETVRDRLRHNGTRYREIVRAEIEERLSKEPA